MRMVLSFFALAISGCSSEVGSVEGALADSDFVVSFDDCVESIGVTLAPTATVSGLVPADFIVAGIADPVTPLVVRTAHCRSASIGRDRSRDVSVVQVGAVIVPPDGTGDINNYTLFYYTDDRRLARALGRTGLDVEHVARIGYSVRRERDGTVSFAVRLPRCRDSALALEGTVVPSNAIAGSFLANWWSAGDRTVKMSTSVPEIAIGGADLVLTAEDDSPIAALTGSTTVDSWVLQQFNAFESAEMAVHVE
jgi:hypothetical protein